MFGLPMDFTILLVGLLAFTGISHSKKPDRLEEEIRTGHERIRQKANHYEVVEIDTRQHVKSVSNNRQFAGERGIFTHPGRSSFVVEAFGKRMRVDLRLSVDLLPSKYEYQYFNEKSELVREKAVEHCYYQGEVNGLGEQRSYAAISACSGFSGVFGSERSQSEDHQDDFIIEPLVIRPAANGSHLHAVYRARDAVKTGTPDQNKEEEAYGNRASGTHSAKTIITSLVTKAKKILYRSKRSSLLGNSETGFPKEMFVELALVLDHTMYELLSTTTDNMQNYALHLVNIANSIMAAMGIQIVLVGIHVQTSPTWRGQPGAGEPPIHGPLQIPDGYLQFFNWWSEKVLQTSMSHDAAVLVTNSPMWTARGYANAGTSCSNQSVILINHYSVFPVDSYSLLHFFLRSLGIRTLKETDFKCEFPIWEGGCVMGEGYPLGLVARPRISYYTLTNGFRGRAWNLSDPIYTALACFVNRPSRTLPLSTCGNGYVEGEEECDCGPARYCQDKCCDAKTCRLAAGAVCSHGPCCHQCQYRDSSHVCRAAVSGGCDVEERCNATSNACPADMHIQSGTPCRSYDSDGHCNLGQCRSRDIQCKRLYDIGGPTKEFVALIPEVRSGSDDCYRACHDDSFRDDKLVIKADCTPDPCSRLFCSNPGSLPAPSRIYGVLKGHTHCAVVKNWTGNGPEFVDDYSPCGTNGLCINRTCVSLHGGSGHSSASTVTAPVVGSVLGFLAFAGLAGLALFYYRGKAALSLWSIQRRSERRRSSADGRGIYDMPRTQSVTEDTTSAIPGAGLDEWASPNRSSPMAKMKAMLKGTPVRKLATQGTRAVIVASGP